MPDYRSILVPMVVGGPAPREALAMAAQVDAERGATAVLLNVLEVPVDLPFESHFTEEEAEARTLLEFGRATMESSGIRAVTRLVRSRDVATPVIAAAREYGSEVIVLNVPQRVTARGRVGLGRNAEAILKGAPCRVMLVALPLKSRQPAPESA